MAAIGMAAVAFLVWIALDRALPAAAGAVGIGRELALVALPAVGGGALYLLLASRLRIEEVTTIIAAIAAKLPNFRD